MSFFLVDAGPEWRDSQRQVLAVARELRAGDHDVRLVLEPGGELLRRAVAEGFAAQPLGLRGRWGWLVRRRLARAMRSRGCQVAHFHDAAGAGPGLAAAAAAQVPVRVLSCPSDAPLPEGRLPFQQIDAVVAGSDAVRAALLQGGVAETAVEVVPVGTDFSRFTSEPRGDLVRRGLGLGPDDFLVGVVLPLEDERGFRSLLEAGAILRGQAPKVRVVVLGEGSLRLEEGEPGPAADPLRFYLGFREDTPRVLASLDMFVVYSHLDGLGGRLVEAMAAGLPVAAADVGTARDLLTHRETGLLVPARNAKALADAIVKVHFDKGLATRLAGRGREAILEKYSVESMARRIVGIYERRAHRKGLKLT